MVASPFPGMDPYLESPDIWADVHSTLINLFREQLNPQLVLVELDLLRRYPRMPFGEALPVCDYVVMVYDAYDGLECDERPLTIRQQLPTISVPLIRPDSPVTLDLALALRTAYERARYDLRIDYKKPTTPPLPAPDAEWVESLMAHRWCMARQIRDSS